LVRGIFKKLPLIQISVGYGLTESFAIATSNPFEDALRKTKAAGKCPPTVNVKIVDDESREVPTGQIGEILLSGAKVFRGYWKKPEATRENLVEGWVHTGDIGEIDEEGFVYILDRKKDMINRGGEKIYSLEVENVICDNPKVLDAAVVGVDDPVLGEVVKACIALKPGQKATNEEIKSFCAERLADYKVPKFVEFMDSLPRNLAGKVGKPELRYVPHRAMDA
jgi:acyl-CoA synthetase (AMP-forming)/AMP-acid ligase II